MVENMEIVIGRICPDNSGFMDFVTQSADDSCEIMRFKNCKAALLYLSLSGVLQGLIIENDQAVHTKNVPETQHVTDTVQAVKLSKTH